MRSRPAIAVVLPSDPTVRVLVESGALATLVRKADAHFIVSPAVSASLPARATKLPLDSLKARWRVRLDMFFWSHSLFVYMREHGVPVEKSFKASHIAPLKRALLQASSVRPFAEIASFMDRWFFSSDMRARELLAQRKPDLVIAPAWAMDTYTHMVLRSARSLGIPTLMVAAHWDYFTKKGLLRVEPTRIYLWGNDMRDAAVNLNRVSPETVRVVGAPQFQKYFDPLPEKTAARMALGLDEGCTWLFFPGAGLPYDELSVLKELDTILEVRRGLSARIAYRPHPKAWDRKSREVVNIADLRHVEVDNPHAPGAQSSEHYRMLLASADGVISPYSTMMLEGGLCGKPALGIGFADEVNEWDFGQVGALEHIAPLLKRNWVLACNRREDLEAAFDRFMETVRQPNIAHIVRMGTRETVFSDHRNYADRLWDTVAEDFGFN